MSDIAKAKPIDRLDSTTLTATETFNETFSGDNDEEAGLNSPTTAVANNAKAAPQAPRGRSGYFIGGTIALLCILALSIGLATRSNDDITAAASTAAATPEVPSAPDAPTIVLNNEDNVNNVLSSDDSGSEPITSEGVVDPFDPQETVGDEALLNWEDILTVSAPSSSPKGEPAAISGSSVINSVISSPTPPPSATPSMKPTFAPSASPSMKPTQGPTKSPTNEPTKSPSSAQPTSDPSMAPTLKPTKSPVVQLDLSGWENVNWSGETEEPSASPSKSPTPAPTNEPTPAPTNDPSSSPTPEPTNDPSSSPTPAPTNEPTTASPTDSPTVSPSNGPTQSPTPANPYFMGDEFYTFSEDGVDINVSKGLSVRLIAKTGSKVAYANGGSSSKSWHSRSDAAGIISLNPSDPLNSGYVYVSNSEEGDRGGGVYGLYMDKDGNIDEYKSLLTGTTDNCGGGLTPWNTFISCEEFSGGQCWQIDPISGDAKATQLGGNGGRYESVAVDNRDPANPVFFTTEDDEAGALRRFVADGYGWESLHSGGDTTFLNILDGNNFEWTDSEDKGRQSASKFFPNTEGIQVHEGKVYFMAKKIQRLLILDMETNTYTAEDTGRKFYGEGSFGNQPDQNFFGPTRKYMYFTEDGGKMPGVYARFGNDETYFTMFEADLSEEDETIGIALSPNNKLFYAGIQGRGHIYEFRRDDGRPFE